MRATWMQTAFNAGEWGAEMNGRVDLDKYRFACSVLENFIPLPQGPATRRPGTKYIGPTGDQSGTVADFQTGKAPAWLYPAVRSAADSKMLVVGGMTGHYAYTYNTNGSYYTPTQDAHVLADYASLSMAVAGDTIWVCSRNGAPRRLLFASGYTLATSGVENGPFADQNTDETKTVYASTRDGTSVTITASSAIFAATDVGRKFMIEAKSISSVKQWEPEKAITSGSLRRSDGKTYLALNSATTGTVKPIHTSGAEYDGDTGVQWAYQDSGWGYGVIQTVAPGGTSCTVNTMLSVEAGGGKAFPDQCVGVSNASHRYAFDAWGSVPGYPDFVCYFKTRLVFARSADRRLWFSVAGDFRNFASTNDSGEISADYAISIQLESAQNNDICWLHPSDTLLIGTPEKIFAVKEMTTADPFGPANVKSVAVSNHGAARVQPIGISTSVVFVARSGKRLRQMTYDALSESYKSRDLSIMHPRIVESAITQLAWMSDPDNIIWATQESGDLLALVFNDEENIVSWSRHKIGGDGQVMSVACIPHPQTDGGYADQLWCVVRRAPSVGSVNYNYTIEVMDTINPYAAVGWSIFLDSYVEQQIGTSTIAGLEHLEGWSVDILLDGKLHPSGIVGGGQVAVNYAYAQGYAGLRAAATVGTMDIEAGSADGVAQSKMKRIARLAIRFVNTLGGKIGASLTQLEDILYREFQDSQNVTPAGFTGDKEVAFNSGYARSARVYYHIDQPFPATIAAIIPKITTERD